MTHIYNEEYYASGCGPDYASSQVQKNFEGIADRIIRDFNPKTVLDAGCAWAYLVAALRDRGVEAYGIDISAYAIGKVREDVRPYCAIGSLTNLIPLNFPQKYDLITNIEILEHMHEEESLQAIEVLCRYTDKILFSSSSDDVTEVTHYNVQQIEYWSKQFSKHGFFRALEYNTNYISPQAVLFERKSLSTERLVEDFEHHIRNLSISNKIAKNKIEEQQMQIRLITSERESERNVLITERDLLAAKLNRILSSRSWRLTKSLRQFTTSIRQNKILYLLAKGLLSIKRNGLIRTFKKVLSYTKRKITGSKQNNFLPLQERRFQENTFFPKKVKISVLVPLYNTPKKFLIEMIKSVQKQTYKDWELCMADGSDKEYRLARKICRKYAKKDSRIKYKKLEKNFGISENTNACIDLSTGDYIGLLDHDDLLHPSALFEVMCVICEHDADIIYTDEDNVDAKSKEYLHTRFKQDFAIDNLRASNYICHFMVFRKSLLDVVGRYNSKFDGSQDHDMVLRLCEKTKNIVHIPKVLYHWRICKNSVALSIGEKPYAAEAGIAAVTDHLRRCGLAGTVESSLVGPTLYRIRYEIIGCPLVSIIIPNNDHVEDLKKCILSIRQKTTYSNYEILVIETNSVTADVFRYYEELEKEGIAVHRWNGEFNYSDINNFGVKHTKAEYIIFLNNNIEIISPAWIEEMLMFCQRDDVGAAGAKLYYPDGTIQHGGVIIGIGGTAGHSHRHFHGDHSGYFLNLAMQQNLSAVTGACMMVKRKVFDKVGGFDPQFAAAYNDIDLCMKIRKAGYLIAWTNYAEAYHCESKSRGIDDTPEKMARFQKEVALFRERWAAELEAGDPYYNVNLTLDREDFSPK
ncbi:MAG: hypothetical protein Ta2B_09600 [Termitinemataceae bacterium]|nr:MAG: hypothetical protein Ta2B_09600 [Termitinemataceae bacterium]